MQVILLILKIIGIILLVLLLILLLLLGLILFVPVRYAISGEILEEPKVQFKITWLLSLISWKGCYQSGTFDSEFRILGRRKWTKPTLSELEEEAVEAEGEDEEDATGENVVSGEPDAAVPEKTLKADVTVKAPEAKDATGKTTVTGKTPETDKIADTTEKFSERRHRRHRSPFARIKMFFLEWKRKLQGFKEAFSKGNATFSKIKEKLFDERNQAALAAALAELKYLLRHFGFREINTDLTFSLGDPAWTGQALGVLAMMPFLYQYQCSVYPDFEAEKPFVRGTFFVKGRVRSVHVIVSLVRLICKKDVRFLIKTMLNK